MSFNRGRNRVREPPRDPRFGGTWGPNPYTLYGSNNRQNIRGM